MKGFGYSAAVGDAGPHHPDANVVRISSLAQGKKKKKEI
jgi:hypothetical protein